jgi:hypothetical protein
MCSNCLLCIDESKCKSFSGHSHHFVKERQTLRREVQKCMSTYTDGLMAIQVKLRINKTLQTSTQTIIERHLQ